MSKFNETIIFKIDNWARLSSLFNNNNNRAINRTKIMSKIEEYKSELVRIQEIAILDTVDLVERANDCDRETKVGRGDSFWLMKSANQTLALAARIEQLIEARNKTQAITTTEDEEKQKEAEAEKLLLSVRKELTKRKKSTKKDDKEGK